MRRREKMLGGLVTATFVSIAASCALNSGAIVYVVADSGAGDGGDITLPDGAILTPDGSILTPDGGPLGKCAPDQVDIDAGFCIDRNEVTNAKYLAFVTAVDDDAGKGFVACLGHPLLPVMDNNELFTSPSLPVRGVDWCAARAYCEWAGKRLCGTLADGGEVAHNGKDFQDAAASEWDFACTQNGALVYPYGNSYDGGACNDFDFKEGGVVPVGSIPSCVGGYPGLYDMAGNVWEWENSCADDTTTNSACSIRGASFSENTITNSRCDNGGGSPDLPRDNPSNNVGIRCCADEH
jgi:formylglycine-generating enzyme required for sulfatase activity